MKQYVLSALLGVLFFGSAATAWAQNGASAHNLVDIAYNGQQVTVDGDLSDWDDAHFIFMSQDSPFFLQVTNNGPVQGVPDNPADFSAYVALKMTDDAIYLGARVRDEGVPLYGEPATPNLAFDFDHISLYLGLFDIGERPSSPHIEGSSPDATPFNFIDPVTEETFEANRHYRIAPGTDDTESTLGPDYQLLLRAVEHDPASFVSRDQYLRRCLRRYHTGRNRCLRCTLGRRTRLRCGVANPLHLPGRQYCQGQRTLRQFRVALVPARAWYDYPL